jgi:hypothetical protein
MVEARRAATDVVVVFADHVGQPRGNWGNCLLQGYVARAERGDALRPRPEGGGILIEGSVPCGNPPRLAPSRQIAMRDLFKGQLIRLYLGPNLALLDAEPLNSNGTSASPAPEER